VPWLWLMTQAHQHHHMEQFTSLVPKMMGKFLL
jgi:hypothetical protein